MTRSTPSSVERGPEHLRQHVLARLGHEDVDHRRALRRADGDLRVVGLRPARARDREVAEGVDDVHPLLDRRVRVVGDDDHRVVGEERVGPAGGVHDPLELVVGVVDRL